MAGGFIGRERELSLLESKYASGRFEFTALYGRRRVGKTQLIRKFSSGKRVIYFQARESLYSENLGRLSEQIWKGLGHESPVPPFMDMDKALEAVFAAGKDKRLIFVIDEYPYLAAPNPSVSSVIQEHVDQNHQSSKVYMILCGSSMSFMERQVLGKKSPLYGRTTSVMRLEPFGYRDAAKFVPSYSPENRLRVYGVAGGVPKFLRLFDDSKTFEENLTSIISEDSVLHSAVRDAVNEEFRAPSTYNAVLSAIASGSRRIKDISSSSGLDGPTVSACLRNLMEIDLVNRETPMFGGSDRNSSYRFRDMTAGFWFSCVKGSLDLIAEGDMGTAVPEVERHFEMYMGLVFEDVCRAFTHQKLGYRTVGRWWGSDPILKTPAEIDIVASEDKYEKKVGLFGECKFTKDRIGADVLELLIDRSRLVGGFDEKRYVLFSRSGFTKAVTERAETSGVMLFGPEDLYR
ncbi:MAG: ATP-binding protein [Candidatus Methanoplasma sp.]|jgi:AAA+ ATPase superfamily predicted ATPase|nr:ATP-binding protein [Candidatus Methanoplasma sp.]